MRTNDTCLTPELLEAVLEEVESNLNAEKPTQPSLEQIWNLVKSSGLRIWALEGAVDLWTVKEMPEGFAVSVLGLLTAGILVGVHLQKAASELSELEALPATKCAPGLTQH